MAYLTFQEVGGAATARLALRDKPVADPVPAGDDRLSPLEWSVVRLARKDGRSSLRRPGRLSTAIRAMFNRYNPMLADRRLEALRRMAVLAWRDGYFVPSHEIRAFLAADFTPRQYETLVDSIIRAKRITPHLAANA